MRARRILFLCAFLILITGGCAAVKPVVDQPSEVSFKQEDAKGAGAVAPTESAAHWRSIHGVVDKNHDGKLSSQEHLIRAETQFVEIDRNGDGVVTYEEYVAFFGGEKSNLPAGEAKPGKSLFHRRDANKDGKVDAAENAQFRAAEAKQMDLNKDGKISKEEFVMFRAVTFKEMDSNGDGVVTVEEWEAWFVAPDCQAPKCGTSCKSAKKCCAGKTAK